VGLEEIIKHRIGRSTMGFESSIKRVSSEENVVSLVEPDDLIKYGLIPEFIGRLPVIATLDELSEEDLVRILVEPIAAEAVRRKTGARGLRAIMEEIMTDIMFEVPSLGNVKKVIVDEDTIRHRNRPRLIYEKAG